MSNYVVADASGTIVKTFSVSAPAETVAAFLTANIPNGGSALAVPDGHAALSDQAGWRVENGSAVQIVPTFAQILTAAKATQAASVLASYQASVATPVAYMSTTFPCDIASQTVLTLLLAVFNQAGAVPPGFYCLDANGNEVPMTLAQLQGLGAAMAAQYLAAIQKRMSLQKQIASAVTAAAVQGIAW